MPGGETIKPGADKAHMDTDTVHSDESGEGSFLTSGTMNESRYKTTIAWNSCKPRPWI